MNSNKEILKKICELISQKDDISETEQDIKERISDLLNNKVDLKKESFSSLIKDILNDKEVNEIIDILSEAQNIVGQLAFLRHGESEDEANNKNNIKKENKSPQNPLSRLSQNGINNIKTAANKIKKDVLKSKKVLFLYGDMTERVKESLFVILKELYYKDSEKYYNLEYSDTNLSLFKEQLKEKGIKIEVDYNFETTELVYETKNGEQVPKERYNTKNTGHNKLQQSKTALGISKISDKLKSEEGTYTLIVSHRTNKGGFLTPFMREEIHADFKMNDGDIIDLNINKEGDIIGQYNDKIANKFYSKNKTMLYINNQNKDDLLLALEKGDNYKITTIIQRYKDENDHFVSLDVLQNYINAYFIKNPSLFEEYLFSENEDIRVFCLANLMERKEFYILEKEILNRDNLLTQQEKEILLSNSKEENIKKLITTLFVSKNKIWEEKEEGEMFEKFKEKELYENLKNKRDVYAKAVEIQSRSLDENISKNKIGGALLRGIKEIIEKEIINKNGHKEKIIEELFINKDTIIERLLNKEKFVLPGDVGCGKSIWITELIKKISIENNCKIMFYEGKDIKNEKIVKKIINLSESDNIIICIDAIDEINDFKIKTKLLSEINNLTCGVILTGRRSEFNSNKNDGFNTLKINPIGKEEFIKSRIKNEKKQKEIFDLLEKSNLANEIEGNPLLLNFICILIKEEGKFNELGIKKFNEIENKA